MKLIIFTIFNLLLALNLYSQVLNQKLSIIKFSVVDDAITESEAVKITEYFNNAFKQNGGSSKYNISVYSKEYVENKYPDFEEKELTNKEMIKELGWELLSPYLIVGNIRKLGDTYILDIKLYDTKPVVIVDSKQIESSGSVDVLLDLVEDAAIDMGEKEKGTVIRYDSGILLYAIGPENVRVGARLGKYNMQFNYRGVDDYYLTQLLFDRYIYRRDALLIPYIGLGLGVEYFSTPIRDSNKWIGLLYSDHPSDMDNKGNKDYGMGFNLRVPIGLEFKVGQGNAIGITIELNQSIGVDIIENKAYYKLILLNPSARFNFYLW